MSTIACVRRTNIGYWSCICQWFAVSLLCFGPPLLASEVAESVDETKQAFFGDLHSPAEPFLARLSADDSIGLLDFYALILEADEPPGQWQQLQELARAYNTPNRLTTFVGFEQQLRHPSGRYDRFVVFQNARVANQPFVPRVSVTEDAASIEDLWLWMDRLRARGIEALSISSIQSVSQDFLVADQSMRLRNEPLIAVGQPAVGAGYSSTLTGVWAEENTREAIYAALRRKETFATTGARIALRMFSGFGFPKTLDNTSRRLKAITRRGVAMGGELHRGRGPLMIYAEARKDPGSASLIGMQVVKVWLNGVRRPEKVFDMNHQSISEDGQTIASLWSDPEFDPLQPVFYYVRALEKPDKNQSTLNIAFSSPVWYSPN